LEFFCVDDNHYHSDSADYKFSLDDTKYPLLDYKKPLNGCWLLDSTRWLLVFQKTLKKSQKILLIKPFYPIHIG
jgi:hypothetical protein